MEGIAVGLSSKILSHNFNELIDASIAYLRNEEFEIFPDFVTGGFIDVSRYNRGERGGAVKVRAKISKLDSKTLVITEIPFGETTGSVIDSIIKASEKGKILVKRVDDNTAANVEILVHLAPGKSPDKAIDALYAFTNCEVSISPNCCVIYENKPHFLGVDDVLKTSADNTLHLLKEELLIQKAEVQESIFYSTLEKIFIENRIYKDKEFEESKSMPEAVAHIDKRLIPFKANFIREVEEDDILKLMEIKMGRILKFNSEKADQSIAALNEQLEQIKNHLSNIVNYTIDWFTNLKEKYGKNYPRRTEIRSFDTIEVTKVIEANQKLYINKEEGFIGTALKKDEFVCNCSEIDDVIVFYKDGKFKVTKVSDKMYVGKNVLYLNIFKKNDKRTIYNVVYRNGKDGVSYIKRFAVNGVTRDKEYDITQGEPGSKILYFSANPNGEAETLKVTLKPKPRLKMLIFERDFSDIAIRGRISMGNIFTKNEIHKVALKQKGSSTLGGREVWFDRDVLRLNYDKRGTSLGEFHGEDLVLVITKDGQYYTTTFDLSNHYEDVFIIEKFDENKIWSVVLFDAEQQFYYVKRFTLEPSQKKVSFLGENPDSKMILLTTEVYPRIEVVFGGKDEGKEPAVIDVEEFIGVKSYKAKGKRVSTNEVEKIHELEPTRFPEPEEEPESEQEEAEEADSAEVEAEEIVSDTDTKIEEEKKVDKKKIIDEITGQMTLF